MKILVTGGAGYIGSHTVVELIAAGHKPVIIDNFHNSRDDVVARLEAMVGQKIPIYRQDFQNSKRLADVLATENIEGAIHFAAHKAVGESVEQPLKYYHNNVGGFIGLMELVAARDIPLVFSSSAAVYGDPKDRSINEDAPCAPTSPYGWSKLMDEIILRDACASKTPARGIALRYFNVVGAHDSGRLGEASKLPPQNLLPIIVQAVAGTREPLTVYGTDYDTPDGTCLRDYVHVVDLAKAHVAALDYLVKQKVGYYDVFNIGTGKPSSVMELISTFERVNSVRVPYKLGERRPGDPTAYYADVTKVNQTFGWKAEKTVEDALRSAWQWQQELLEAGT